jgi:hypothetical protein
MVALSVAPVKCDSRTLLRMCKLKCIYVRYSVAGYSVSTGTALVFCVCLNFAWATP